ncbi:unnamed protein product [Angiostrongylus costaricensis]|uniref:Vesicle transport protein n=1 Tax=Angiostrongylus costaricensis TaxID=334426 RepID=A0A0R3PG45_ANGCS|nr:unnamed protein product [Angiostrongylus costaricensis]
MNDVTNLYKAYRDEIECQVERFAGSSWDFTTATAKKIEEELASTSTASEITTESVINVMSDTADVETPKNVVVQVFAWATVTVTASMIGTFMGYTVLSPILISNMEKHSAFILAYVVLPLIATLVMRMYDHDPRYCGPHVDAEVRYISMTFAVLQGYMPICAGKNRLALLSTSLNFAMAMNIAFGAIMNWLTLAYYMLSFCYVLGSWITLQLAFLNIRKNNLIHVHQHLLVSILIGVKGTFFLLFGSYA